MARPYNPAAWRHRFCCIGKYILSASALMAWRRTVPAPVAQATLAELHERFPDRVRLLVLGIDKPQPTTLMRVTDHGRACLEPVAANAATPAVLHTIDGGGAVSRACCLVGPERTAIRETGFFLDRRLSGPLEFRKLRPRYWRQRLQGDLTARFRLPEPEHVAGRVVVLNNWQAHNYYHWLVEVAPRAAAVDLAGIDVAGYLVDHQRGYQRRVLEMLGIPASRLIQPHAAMHLTADELLWVSQPGETLLRHFIGMLEPSITPLCDPAADRRLFISRRKARHRRLANERVLERKLGQLGFQSVCFEDIPFERQAALMREASVVVAVHGAALANAMFARPGTRIVEIYPDRRANKDLYPHWSRLYGFDHHTVMADCSTFRQQLTVPIDDVLAAVQASPGQSQNRPAADT